MSTTTAEKIKVHVSAVWGADKHPDCMHKRMKPVAISLDTEMPVKYTGEDIERVLEAVWKQCNRITPDDKSPVHPVMDEKRLPSMSVGDGVILMLRGENRYFVAEKVGFEEVIPNMFWDFMNLDWRDRSMGLAFGFWRAFKPVA